MLFLLNTVVVKTQLGLELPEGLEGLARLSPRATLNAGRELYANRPRLEYENLDIARWYCTLLLHKFPTAGAARFYATGKGYAGELTPVSLPELARFWTLQNAGVDIAAEVRQGVWLEPVKPPEASTAPSLPA